MYDPHGCESYLSSSEKGMAEWDTNPSECQCSALLVELSGHLEAGHYASLKMMVRYLYVTEPIISSQSIFFSLLFL